MHRIEAPLSIFVFDRTGNERSGAVPCGNTRETLCEIRVFTMIYRADTRSFSPGYRCHKQRSSGKRHLLELFWTASEMPPPFSTTYIYIYINALVHASADTDTCKLFYMPSLGNCPEGLVFISSIQQLYRNTNPNTKEYQMLLKTKQLTSGVTLK